MTGGTKTIGKQIIFDHEKLNVYQVAIEFVILADEVIEHTNLLLPSFQRIPNI